MELMQSNKKVYFPLRKKDFGYIKRLVNIIIDVLQEKNNTAGEKEFLRDTIYAIIGLPSVFENFSASLGFSCSKGKSKNEIYQHYHLWMNEREVSLSYREYKGLSWTPNSESYNIIWFYRDVKKRIDWLRMDKWFNGVGKCLKGRHSVSLDSDTILIKGRQIDMNLPFK